VSPPAIDPFVNTGRKVNDQACIRCYCGHEFCPVKAVYLERSRADRLLHLDALFDAASRLVGRFARR
jgi:Fe-S-cluster-containing hydrogenase component 2